LVIAGPVEQLLIDSPSGRLPLSRSGNRDRDERDATEQPKRRVPVHLENLQAPNGLAEHQLSPAQIRINTANSLRRQLLWRAS
jgi:hypothetical protein